MEREEWEREELEREDRDTCLRGNVLHQSSSSGPGGSHLDTGAPRRIQGGYTAGNRIHCSFEFLSSCRPRLHRPGCRWARRRSSAGWGRRAGRSRRLGLGRTVMLNRGGNRGGRGRHWIERNRGGRGRHWIGGYVPVGGP